jgi:hypothetical protein
MSTGDGRSDLLDQFGEKGSWSNFGVPDRTGEGAASSWLGALPAASQLSRGPLKYLVDPSEVAKALAENCPRRPKKMGSVCATLWWQSLDDTGWEAR